MKEFVTPYTELSAALCNPMRELGLASLETALIVASTRHADILGIGYFDLIKRGTAWVLSRMSIEMTRMPRVGESYAIRTWVESFNRHLSERNFEIFTSEGEILGYARSLWACIDIERRRPAQLPSFDLLSARECPIERQPKLRMPDGIDTEERNYRFTYSDLDFNNHVNSARYVEQFADSVENSFRQPGIPVRFDIVYQHEALLGEESIVESVNVDGIYYGRMKSAADETKVFCQTSIRYGLRK